VKVAGNDKRTSLRQSKINYHCKKLHGTKTFEKKFHHFLSPGVSSVGGKQTLDLRMTRRVFCHCAFIKSSSGTLVEHSPRHPKVKGFLAAPVADTWRKKVVENFSSKIFVLLLLLLNATTGA
jgi:hypothetical protein